MNGKNYYAKPWGNDSSNIQARHCLIEGNEGVFLDIFGHTVYSGMTSEMWRYVKISTAK